MPNVLGVACQWMGYAAPAAQKWAVGASYPFCHKRRQAWVPVAHATLPGAQTTRSALRLALPEWGISASA